MVAGACDVGAFETADIIFADGFETGTLSHWE